MKLLQRRKLVVLIIGLLAMIGSVGSQAQFRYGPAVGIDITNLKFKQNLFTVDKSVGYSAGLQAEMMFPGIGFGIDFGLFYEQKGATLHLSEKELWNWQKAGNPRSYLHYASLPFHLRFKWTRLNGLEDYIAPFVYAGPSFGILVAHNKIPALQYAGGDVGVDLGLGFEINKKFQISASYSWGMTYALKAKVLTDYSAKNRTWLVRAAWLF